MAKVNQKDAIEQMLGTRNCFLTGAGGVGKGWCIGEVTREYNDIEIPYIQTASTGIAAQLINGKTVHSTFGLGSLLPKHIYCEFEGLYDEYLDKIEEDSKATTNLDMFKYLETLSEAKDNLYIKMIDEMTELVKTYLGNKNYFWSKIVPFVKELGVIIIDEISMLGATTFTILDAVLRLANGKQRPFGGIKIIIVGDPFQLPPVNDEYFMMSPSYWAAKFLILNLTKNYRATNDDWNMMLKKIRIGRITDDIEDMFDRRSRKKAPNDITRIVSTNKEADNINQDRLNSILRKSVTFKYSYRDKYDILGGSKGVKDFFKNSIIKPSIDIKIDAYVMIVVNDTKSGKYVNGTTGKVVHIDENGIIVRTASGEDIEISGYHPFKIEKTIKNPNYGEMYINESGKEVFDDCEIILAEATISALPVIHAWAITVHKSQGQTLDSARIDLTKGFVDGQAYVALSRVRSEEGVFLDGFPTQKSLEVNDQVFDYVIYLLDSFTKPMKVKITDMGE